MASCDALAIRDDLDVHPGVQGQAGARVPQVVQPYGRHTGPAAQEGRVAGDEVGPKDGAVLAGEDRPASCHAAPHARVRAPGGRGSAEGLDGGTVDLDEGVALPGLGWPRAIRPLTPVICWTTSKYSQSRSTSSQRRPKRFAAAHPGDVIKW